MSSRRQPCADSYSTGRGANSHAASALIRSSQTRARSRTPTKPRRASRRFLRRTPARLTYLQTSQHEWLTKRARAQQLDVEPQTAVRGLILDRQGRELARSVSVDSFFADPREIENTDEAASSLAQIFKTDAGAAHLPANFAARMADKARARAAA